MPSDSTPAEGDRSAGQQRFWPLFLRSKREAFRHAGVLASNVADTEIQALQAEGKPHPDL